jgi:hypothetical protein
MSARVSVQSITNLSTGVTEYFDEDGNPSDGDGVDLDDDCPICRAMRDGTSILDAFEEQRRRDPSSVVSYPDLPPRRAARRTLKAARR